MITLRVMSRMTSTGPGKVISHRNGAGLVRNSAARANCSEKVTSWFRNATPTHSLISMMVGCFPRFCNLWRSENEGKRYGRDI